MYHFVIAAMLHRKKCGTREPTTKDLLIGSGIIFGILTVAAIVCVMLQDYGGAG